MRHSLRRGHRLNRAIGYGRGSARRRSRLTSRAAEGAKGLNSRRFDSCSRWAPVGPPAVDWSPRSGVRPQAAMRAGTADRRTDHPLLQERCKKRL